MRKSIPGAVLTLSLLTLLTWPGLVLASFSDVTVNVKQFEAITQLEKAGVISGYPDGTFHPNEAITSSQLLKMTFAHIGYKPSETSAETKFQDVPVDSWFAPYVKKALELGSISYKPDLPKFFPEQPLTKIEALKMVLPLEGIPAPFLADQSPIGYNDVKIDSSYAYLVRAAKNANLFKENISKGQNNFAPFKLLTRAEAAELLYNCQLYREQGSGQTDTLVQDSTSTNNGALDLSSLSQSELDIINNPKFPIFISVWNKINEKYYNQQDVDQNKLIYGAIDGMVNSLNDQYSVFEDPTKSGALQDSLEGRFDGIGTVLDTIQNNFTIVTVMANSPAEKAGIKIGDIITKVNDQDLKALTIEQVVSLIKGNAGSKVKLTIQRDGKTLEFNLVRETLKLNSLYKYPNTAIIPDDIGYIAIHQFTSTTATEFEDILKKTLASKPKALIIDLRDNPGGYLDSAYRVMGHFIPNGQSVMKLKLNGQLIDEKSSGKGELSTLPIVVLINKYSASAAEVMAGALQDYKLAKLVGDQSYGKGTVQEVSSYSDSSLLKLSIAYWLTPLNNSINKIGLTPDYKVEISKQDELNNIDPQIQKAVDLLK